jgi:hypothetical protein
MRELHRVAGRADVRWGDGYHLPIVGVAFSLEGVRRYVTDVPRGVVGVPSVPSARELVELLTGSMRFHAHPMGAGSPYPSFCGVPEPSYDW